MIDAMGPSGRSTLTPGGLRSLASACLIALLAVPQLMPHALAQDAGATDAVFTVGNYPVDAEAENAVEAKQKALADGQRSAFRSLLKRIVPVTAYGRLQSMKAVKAADLVDSVSVRSERNSNTRYIASLDFTFSPNGVRELLRKESIPFIDVQAPAAVLVPIVAGPAGAEPPNGQSSRMWQQLWESLDLSRSLTPLRLSAARAALDPGLLSALKAGDSAGYGKLATEHRSDTVVAVLAEPEPAAGRLNVTVVGQDAVGPIVLKRKFRMDPDDQAYAMEYAAVVVLGVLEGRWKARRVQDRGGMAAISGPGEAVEIVVEFSSRAQWEALRQKIAGLPGVEGVDVMSLSARNAVLALRYPGGGPQLASTASARGILLVPSGGGVWTLRSSY